MTGSPISLAWRGILALFLLVTFYLFSTLLALGLLYLVYAEFYYIHRVHIKLAFFCVVGAGVILYSIFPRRDKFEPPGPRLSPAHQPKLFTELNHIASSVGQKMPEEVYLVHDANAFVTQRGGFLGIGTKRIIGLGIPLLRALNASEFRGVLAHEFGHFHGGDTGLSPLIYRTRSAIIRAIEALGEHSSILQTPYIWYGKLFLRITHAISRYQEFTADAVATRVVGPDAMISGLQKTHAADIAFQSFWEQEYLPVLSAGYYAPLIDGFAKFLGEKSIDEAISKAVREEIASAKTDPYDTHPPLRERIIALKNLRIEKIVIDETSAISLLRNLPELEKELLIWIGGDENAKKLKTLSWKDTPKNVYLPIWQSHLMEPEARKILDRLQIEHLPNVAKDSKQLEQKLAHTLSDEEKRSSIHYAIGAALTILLHSKGFELETEPGAPIFCRKENTSIEPFKILEDLAQGKISIEKWKQICSEAKISGIDLGASAHEQHWRSNV